MTRPSPSKAGRALLRTPGHVGKPARALHVRVDGHEHEPVVAAHDAERLAARERAAELVEREPEPGALGRPELGSARAQRAHREHADRRAGDQQRPRRRARAPPARARAASAPSSVVEQPQLELPLRLLELVAAVHRRADLGRAALGRLAVVLASATGRRRSATGSRTARPGSGSARIRATRSPTSGRGAVRTGSVAVAMPWEKCRSRIARGVSRVRIAVRRTSSSEPSVGLYASRRSPASSTSTERSSSALSCSTRAWTSSSRGGIEPGSVPVRRRARLGPAWAAADKAGGDDEDRRLDPQRRRGTRRSGRSRPRSRRRPCRSPRCRSRRRAAASRSARRRPSRPRRRRRRPGRSRTAARASRPCRCRPAARGRRSAQELAPSVATTSDQAERRRASITASPPCSVGRPNRGPSTAGAQARADRGAERPRDHRHAGARSR